MGLGLGLGPVGILSEIILPIFANLEEQKAIKAANDENTRRYDEGLANIRGLRSEILPALQRSGRELVRSLQEAYGMSKEQAAGLTKQFEDRYSRVMKRLEGAGDQERKDISTAFRVDANNQVAGLTQRGLGSTSMVNAVRNAATEGTADSIGRLNERLRREYTDADLALSGDVMASKGREIDLQLAGASAVGGAQYDAAGRLASAQSGLTEAENAWIYGREDAYMPTNTLRVLSESLSRARQSKAQEDAAKGAGGGGGGAIGAGIGAAGAVIAAPFTAGASLAFLPALTAAGGAAGGIYDASQGGGYTGPSGDSLYRASQSFAPRSQQELDQIHSQQFNPQRRF